MMHNSFGMAFHYVENNVKTQYWKTYYHRPWNNTSADRSSFLRGKSQRATRACEMAANDAGSNSKIDEQCAGVFFGGRKARKTKI